MTITFGQLPPARVLPVVLLADCSGSMSEDGKIESLNHAISTMIRVLAGADDRDSEIHLALVGIGGEVAELRNPLTPVTEFAFTPLRAEGGTPTGSAIELAAQILSDEALPANAHHPILVLVTDGHPTDGFDWALDRLLRTELGSGSTRFALGIGADAHPGHLERFASEGRAGVLGADQVADIDRFFRAVTQTVTNQLPTMTTGRAPTESLGSFADNDLPRP